MDLNRLSGVEYSKTLRKNKYLLFPRPHHINLLKLYNKELYEPKNTIFSGTIEIVGDDGSFSFSSKMDTVKIKDYYAGFYVHIFAHIQKGYVVSSYDYENKKFSVPGLSSESIEQGMRFWIYRPKYVAKIVNNEIEKREEGIVLYDRDYLLTQQQWIPKIQLLLSNDERTATIKSF